MKNRHLPLLLAACLAACAGPALSQGAAVFTPLPPSAPSAASTTPNSVVRLAPPMDSRPARPQAARDPASLHGLRIGMDPQRALQALSEQPGLSAAGLAADPGAAPRQEQLLSLLLGQCSGLATPPNDGTSTNRSSCMFEILGSPAPTPEAPDDEARADRIQVTLEFRDAEGGPKLSAALFCAAGGAGRSTDWALDEFGRQAGFSGLSEDITQDSKLLLMGAATTFCPLAAPDAGASAQSWTAWIDTDPARGDKATHAALRGQGSRGMFDLVAWFETLEEAPAPEDAAPPVQASSSPAEQSVVQELAPKP